MLIEILTYDMLLVRSNAPQVRKKGLTFDISLRKNIGD